ncbi:hypothetical protein [Pinibacter soli]|uniref:Uncharacterized protein n=1 Tax=Pinibacter soli TaxID=3044211 RepID=A0ABT6RHR0_9BACT|nr:hypothetical protein [Pinibacter soli]MDI3321389.1 hypothetical protein [Pinibacter soli]
MRYLLKALIVAVLSMSLSAGVNALQAQKEMQPLGIRLASRTNAFKEMIAIGNAYQSTDLLSYNVAYDFADSAALSTSLEHKEGQYKMFDKMFWGIVDSSMEYLQGNQYYISIDHDSKNIYISNKLNYSRALNIPLLDSIYNESTLQDLILKNAGGIYKKLTIQYLPNMPYKQVEMVYDSTTHLLKSIAYYYNTIYYPDQNTLCDNMQNQLIVPSTGTTMPVSITPALLIKTYKNFIAEFPGHTKGATVHMFVPGSQGSAYNSVKNYRHNDVYALMQEPGNFSYTYSLAVSKAKGGPNNMDEFTATPNLVTDSITPPPPASKVNLLGAPAGNWVDSTMNGLQLFEWYMNEHLALNYKAEVYAEWLVNTCNYKLYQLPWSNDIAIVSDTLQNIWNQFANQYPSNQLSITETINVPIVNSMLIKSDMPTVVANEDGIVAGTWTNGTWFVQRAGATFDLSMLAKNATINSATLNLYANNYYGLFASQFRYVSQYPFMQIQPVRGIYVAGKTTFELQPEVNTNITAVNLPSLSNTQISSESSDDFWSEQNYYGQKITGLIASMYTTINNTGINYPVQYRMNDEGYVYKIMQFGGISCSNPAKRPSLNISYTAARWDVFTAFVNNTLKLNLSNDQVKDIYKYAGKLEINNDCTVASAGIGCGGASVGRPITGVTTITLNQTNATENDLPYFGESKFIYKVGDAFYPTAAYSGYKIIPVLNNN